MRRQSEQQSHKVDYSEITPVCAMRTVNCKTSKFLHKETYPSIRPKVSKCSNEQTKVWLADAVEENGCARPFGSDHDDNLLDAWKQSPNKESLSCYGIGTEIHRPEAIVFNKVLTHCLDMVNGLELEVKRSKTSSKLEASQKSIGKKPKGAYVLNRQVLCSKINSMPTIQKRLGSKNTMSHLYCPPPADPDSPFAEDEFEFPLMCALDMEKPVAKSKHGLRRKYKYCEVKCDLPMNKCTAYEWMKYKQDPLSYEVAFEMEMDEMSEQRTQAQYENQPKDYDELYEQLICCFEKNSGEIPPCPTYVKCCKPQYTRSSVQGCGEYEIRVPPGTEFCNTCN